jgi:hypothetical protein
MSTTTTTTTTTSSSSKLRQPLQVLHQQALLTERGKSPNVLSKLRIHQAKQFESTTK